MSTVDTLAAIIAANAVLIEWIQSLPPDKAATVYPDQTHLVMTYDHLIEAWALHLVSLEYDDSDEDVISYTCSLPTSVHTALDIAEYLMSTDWLDTLVYMSQDYDAFHGPDPVNLD